MLRTALRDRAEKDDDTTQFLIRTVLLLTSPMAWLYWNDYLGLDPAEAAVTAGWAIKAFAGATRPPQHAADPPPGPPRQPAQNELIRASAHAQHQAADGALVGASAGLPLRTPARSVTKARIAGTGDSASAWSCRRATPGGHVRRSLRHAP
jgi:hypothetical protein